MKNLFTGIDNAATSSAPNFAPYTIATPNAVPTASVAALPAKPTPKLSYFFSKFFKSLVLPKTFIYYSTPT